MSKHLLPLCDFHAAAPGVLDVVFGLDGDFKGAPDWACSLLIAPDYGGGYILCASPQLMREGVKILFADTGTLNMADCHFDLRVPSVAARLAGLCARALGHRLPATWSIQNERGGVFALVGVAHTPRTSFDSTIVLRWDRGRAMGYGSGGDAQHPSITTTATDGTVFLRDLVLALAPQIAALGTR